MNTSLRGHLQALLDDVGEELAGAAHEGQALLVFVRARRLAHEHELRRSGCPGRRRCLAPARELAALAVADPAAHAFEVAQRRRRPAERRRPRARAGRGGAARRARPRMRRRARARPARSAARPTSRQRREVPRPLAQVDAGRRPGPSSLPARGARRAWPAGGGGRERSATTRSQMRSASARLLMSGSSVSACGVDEHGRVVVGGEARVRGGSRRWPRQVERSWPRACRARSRGRARSRPRSRPGSARPWPAPRAAQDVGRAHQVQRACRPAAFLIFCGATLGRPVVGHRRGHGHDRGASPTRSPTARAISSAERTRTSSTPAGGRQRGGTGDQHHPRAAVARRLGQRGSPCARWSGWRRSARGRCPRRWARR